jgi:very-short-patch-repair endonuclease
MATFVARGPGRSEDTPGVAFGSHRGGPRRNGEGTTMALADTSEGDAAQDGILDEALSRRITRAVAAWTGQLVDITGRNTLLAYKDLKAGTLELTKANDVALEGLLGTYTVRFSEAFAGDDLAPAARRARAILARADENYQEKGLQTLFAAWGMATWTNTRSTFTPCAPILLRQAHLAARGGAAEDFDLALPGEWEINPTLLHVLANEFDVRVEGDVLLDLLEDQEPPDASALFERLAKEAAHVPGFAVAERVVLANFSYAKLPMVNDLAQAEDLLAQNTLICAIAGDTDAASALKERHGEVSKSAPDYTPPSDEFLVLDADASQSYAINAVVGGSDLVIDGPPGTGKSQTIANLIATLSARGKRVLFVAEKRAAIDAVLSRLEKVGLSDLVLDLHDGPGAKGKLAQAFAKALGDASRAQAVNMDVAQEQLLRRRGTLVRRTEALHHVRTPWGVSVYDLQAKLIGVPAAVRSDLRLGTHALVALDAEAFRASEADLEAYVGMGGLKIGATDSPWLRALDAGTITTPAQAAAVMEAMTTFTNHTLPQATAKIESTLSSVGLARPDTVAGWARTLVLMDQASGVLEQFDPAVFDLDLDDTLAALVPVTSGGGARIWHSMFDAKFKSAKKAVRACVKGAVPATTELHSALSGVAAVLGDWRAACTDGGLPGLPPDLDGARGTYGQLVAELQHLELALGSDELEELGPENLKARLGVFIADRETLFKLPELHRLSTSLESAGLGPLLAELRTRNLTVDQAVACLGFVWRSSALDAISISDPEIGTFEGEAHSRTVAEFRRSDIDHITTTPQRIRRIVAEHITAARDAYPTESQLVTKEAAKKRKHVPIRLLFQQAPHVLTALKPCWAMSPLVVAQVLPVDKCFDVVIFDEASQVTPESAVGALMRAERAVVAGDPHQLPPTTFFASGSNLDDAEEEDAEDAAALTRDIESLLDMMGALLPPPIGTKRLNWHYRSRDERLIAFSNSQPGLYDWSLTTFPGAQTNDVITHELVPFVEGRVGQEDSVADEVKAVVAAVAEHAHERPEMSLGVITMGIKHMDRIAEELRRARQVDPELDDFLDATLNDNEQFFVKNLERVQGDERDAILISIGYGKNAEGKMLYRFGPLNQRGGERRLNVAVTRARARIGVISSFGSADLDPARLKADGAKMLRDYLRYAESGGSDLGERQRERDPLNPFEADVYQQLSAAGLALECQVGCSGYWIDFAAKHPSEPGRYVLAIEADGAMYHSSATARDRDRLRQDHLERLGWRFHRIWSSEWFKHREIEVGRVMAAYEEALRTPAGGPRAAGEERASPFVAGAHVAEEGLGARTAAMPFWPDGRPITEYYTSDLVSFIKWLESDGQLRTQDELITLAITELRYERSSAPRRATLAQAIDKARNQP